MKNFELVREVAKRSGHSQEVVKAVLDCMCGVIAETVSGGEEVNLPSLGKFRCKVNPAREGINPLTKEKIHIKETRTIAFRAAACVKKTVD